MNKEYTLLIVVGLIIGYLSGYKIAQSDASRLTGQQVEAIYLKGKLDALVELKKQLNKRKEIML